MADAAYQRLSGLDHAFLHFETSDTPMHVALTGIFAPGSFTRPDGGVDIQGLRAHIASRLHLIPRYRQRLHYVPVARDPVWIDAPDFDLDFHVRHSHLPRPGTDAQLRALVARLLERPLDRSRPLWETWFIEGLEGGRFAMLCKVHHCMVDGIAGIDILAALLDVDPEAPPATRGVDPWVPAPIPSGAQLLRDDVKRRAVASIDLARRLPDLVAGGSTGSLGARLGSLWGFLSAGVTRAAETPLNGTVGPHRRIAWATFDLARVKAVKQSLGGTLNDVVLATVTGVLRRFLAERGAETSGEFRALVPVSTRAVSERGVAGNRVSAWIAPLPVAESDARTRYDLIRSLTAEYRANQEERGAEVLTDTADWTTSHALALAVRLLRQSRAFNVVVTNVPGPPVGLHLLDAPMVAAYPHVPLFEHQGLGIALLSYAGALSFGFVGDWDLLPDLDRVVAWTHAAFAELCELAGMEPEPGERQPAKQRLATRDGRTRRPLTAVLEGQRRSTA